MRIKRKIACLACDYGPTSTHLTVWVKSSPEVAEHPDSKKVGVLAEFSSEGDGKPTVMRYIIRNQAGMADYWEGE